MGLADDEWELIGPLLPIGRSGPYAERLRQAVRRLLWRLRTGAQWRDVSGEFGAWQTVYNRFVQWRDAADCEAVSA
ncbi:transposase [Streptomyces sp. NPDC054786]